MLQRFAVVETVVGEPGFEARHPEIRTYAGQGVDDPRLSIAMDLTPMGFHASVRNPSGGASWYVDPAFDRRGESRHLSYFGAAVPPSSELFVERDLEDAVQQTEGGTAQLGAPDAPVVQKDFRLALVTDPSYATYFGAANVTAEKASLIHRVNQVYMDDMAIRFLLITDNDLLNLDTAALATTPAGPCGASACYTADQLADGCTGDLLDRTTFVTGQIVGAESFDIGHIGLGINGGGIAGLGVVGGASKAQGCTGLPTPEGDFFAVDYVAHEMGHQMGADHTFNGVQQNCSATNRALFPGTTQVEPGSGSSVMAYAGICQQDNLQPHSDPYFSFTSVEQITDVVAQDTAVENEQQTVTLTDFDADGDSFQLTYPAATPVTVTRGTDYTSLQVAQKIFQLTGCRVTLSGYEGGIALNDDGFVVDFNLGGLLPADPDCNGTDVARLGVVGVGDVTGFVGVQVNGGPTTNEGASNTTANTNPVVVAPADKTLPIRTPFTLTGSGTDDDGDPLVYLWEQTDPGSLQGTALVSNSKTEGPLFRMFGTYADVSKAEALQSPSPDLNLATSDPSRTFPDLAQVLAGNTNAATGACPAAPAPPASGGASNVPVRTVECYSEFLPTAGYANNVITAGELNFRLSARDQVTSGGGYAYDDVTLTLDGSAGPFLVTSQATPGARVQPGSTQTVTWAVNGTDAAGLAPNVRITLSLDGGQTFPTELVASTPNDGSQAVTIPAVETAAARIKVEAVDNYFFDVNDSAFAIGSPPDTSITSGPASKSFVLTRSTRFSLASTTPGSTFVCTLDGRTRPCAASTAVKYRPGTHVFTASARSVAGLLDPTPATRVFASPFNDGQLRRVTRGWTRVKDKRSYRGAYLTTSSKDQVLTRKASRVTKVALVVHTGPGFGRVAVLLNGKRLKVLDLSSPSLTRKVLVKVSGVRGRSGTFSIRTLDDKPVRIDGLGLLTRVKR